MSYAIKHLEDAARRGFTTVRDPGGGDVGLALAIELGQVRGPRFLYGGRALSQTGGHGDMRPGVQEEPCNCAYSGVICPDVSSALPQSCPVSSLQYRPLCSRRAVLSTT